MTERVHECKYQLRQTLTYRRFVCSGCPNIISITDAEEILNECGTLKAATERLSAELAREIGDCLYAGIIDHERKSAVLAYADILEGKDD